MCSSAVQSYKVSWFEGASAGQTGTMKALTCNRKLTSGQRKLQRQVGSWCLLTWPLLWAGMPITQQCQSLCICPLCTDCFVMRLAENNTDRKTRQGWERTNSLVKLAPQIWAPCTHWFLGYFLLLRVPALERWSKPIAFCPFFFCFDHNFWPAAPEALEKPTHEIYIRGPVPS